MPSKGYDELLHEKTYTREFCLNNAALIFHPKARWYNIAAEEIAHILEIGSNFTRLKNPIQDTWGNVFQDTEWYYMAWRTDDLEIKKYIAEDSQHRWRARRARVKYDLTLDEKIRIDIMREATKLKYDNNPELHEILLASKPRIIIEYTYRKDIFFGIDQETLTGQNILGKLLMEYRD